MIFSAQLTVIQYHNTTIYHESFNSTSIIKPDTSDINNRAFSVTNMITSTPCTTKKISKKDLKPEKQYPNDDCIDKDAGNEILEIKPTLTEKISNKSSLLSISSQMLIHLFGNSKRIEVSELQKNMSLNLIPKDISDKKKYQDTLKKLKYIAVLLKEFKL